MEERIEEGEEVEAQGGPPLCYRVLLLHGYIEERLTTESVTYVP